LPELKGIARLNDLPEEKTNARDKMDCQKTP
jgi:hypothetical protein